MCTVHTVCDLFLRYCMCCMYTCNWESSGEPRYPCAMCPRRSYTRTSSIMLQANNITLACYRSSKEFVPVRDWRPRSYVTVQSDYPDRWSMFFWYGRHSWHWQRGVNMARGYGYKPATTTTDKDYQPMSIILHNHALMVTWWAIPFGCLVTIDQSPKGKKILLCSY